MDKKTAFTIINNYFNSWLQQDKELFLSQLHDEIIVRECTGDMYNNKVIASNWFAGWNIEGNKVLRWEICESHYDREKQVAVVEWVFECMYESNKYSFEGASIVEFKDGLIIKIGEYKMDINKKYPYGKRSKVT